MNEYKIRELASYMEAYYKQEANPDYTADGLEKAILWATAGADETVAGWSVSDVLDRAWGEFDLQLTMPQARKILANVATTDVNWDAVDYCIQQWKDKNR